MSARQAAPPFTDGWNEAYSAPGRPRPHYRAVLRTLERLGWPALAAGVSSRIDEAQASFSSGPLAVCPVPRLIDHEEWSILSAGVAQRAAALAEFVVDAYDARRICSAGIVPEHVVIGAAGYEPELHGRWPAGLPALGIAGLDIVRDRDGELLVLEDNTRTPSGFAYALAAREAVMATLEALTPAAIRAAG